MGNFILTGFADEISSDLEEQTKVLQRLGMTHLELRGVYGKGMERYTIKEAKEIANLLGENGLSVSAMGSPIGKRRLDEDFEAHFELFRHVVELAHLFGTQFIRMFSFFVPNGEEARNYREEVLERVGRFVEYAKENDVILLHENEKEIYGDVANRCLELMEAFYGDHFKAVFDFANFVQCGQDTLEAYRLLKPYIAYVHVKDAFFKDGRVVPAGYGEGNVAAILKDLKESGYNGFLSLEPHLTEFRGFEALENGGQLGKELTGQEAFQIAHSSLIKLLKEI